MTHPEMPTDDVSSESILLVPIIFEAVVMIFPPQRPLAFSCTDSLVFFSFSRPGTVL